jgi:hypothetical protein
MVQRSAFRLLRILAAGGVALISGCTPASGAPAPAPVAVARPGNAQPEQAARLYGENMVRMVLSDQILTQILINAHVTATLRIALLVAPDGVVEKGLMLSSAPPGVEQAVLGRLTTMNFGNFSAAMPDRKLIFLISVIPPGSAGPAGQGRPQAVPAFEVKSIDLYQPSGVLVARLGTAAPLAAYIQRIDASLAPIFAAAPPQPGVTLAVVVGVKPNFRSKAWVVAPNGSLPAPMVAQIEAAAEAVPPVRVQGGPIAFAVLIDAWGGGPAITDATHPVPIPQAWLSSTPSAPEIVPDGIFARIWP